MTNTEKIEEIVDKEVDSIVKALELSFDCKVHYLLRGDIKVKVWRAVSESLQIVINQ